MEILLTKVERKYVIIESLSYNFEQRYKQEMVYFDDCRVINVHVLSRTVTDDKIREEYLIFYEVIPYDGD